jgi:hypothetical protein
MEDPEKPRAPVVQKLRFGRDLTVGILAPLPASLSHKDLVAALTELGGDPSNLTEWLGQRLLEVTGKSYKVELDIRGCEQKGSFLVYEPIRIRELTGPSASVGAERLESDIAREP